MRLVRFPVLQPHYLAILSAIPEIAHPNLFQKLLPRVKGSSVTLPFKAASCSTSLSAHDIELLYNTADAKPNPDSITVKAVSEWWSSRAAAYDNCGLLDFAFSFVGQGVARGVEGLDDLLIDLKHLCVLVYEVQYPNITLSRFRELGVTEKSALFLHAAEKDTFFSHVQLYLQPFVHSLPVASQVGVMSHVLLPPCTKDLSLALHVLQESSLSIPEECRVIRSYAELCQFLCDMLQSAPGRSGSATAAVTELLELIPTDDVLSKHKVTENCAAALRQLRDLHQVRLKLQDVHMSMSVQQLLALDKDSGRAFLERFAARVLATSEADQKPAVLDSVAGLNRLLTRSLSDDDCFAIFLKSLLSSGDESDLQVAKAQCSQSTVSQEQLQDIALGAAQEHINALSSADLNGLQLAKTCLCDLAPPNEPMTAEMRFLQAVELLISLVDDFIPLGLRLSENKTTFLINLLKKKSADSTRNEIEKWVTVGELLNQARSSVLAGLAEACLSNADHDTMTEALDTLFAEKPLDLSDQALQVHPPPSPA